MTSAAFTSFTTRDALQSAAAKHIEAILRTTLEQRQSATILCAGGSTPKPVYRQISGATLDWSRVHVGLTDERWVDETDDASNAGMIRRELLRGHADAARFTPMVTDATCEPAEAMDTIGAAYHHLTMTPDLAVVGMGPDAHTLSWFPGADGLNHALDPETSANVATIEAIPSDVTGNHTTRVTLTLPVIVRTEQVVLLITGEAKRAALEAAASDAPISHLIRAAGSRLTTYWAP